MTADHNGWCGLNLDEEWVDGEGDNVTLNKVTTRFNISSGIYSYTDGNFKGSNIISLMNSNDGLTVTAGFHTVTITNSMFISNSVDGIHANMGIGSAAPFTLTNVFFTGNAVKQVEVIR